MDSRGKLLNDAASRLGQAFRCPECALDEAVLRAEDESLVCTRCGTRYPVGGNVPFLLSTSSQRLKADVLDTPSGEAMVAEYRQMDPVSTGKARQRWYQALKPPQCLLHTNPDLDAPHTRPIFDHRGPDTLVLNVGGGPHRYRDNEITLNLEAFLNVDVVGDAHNLPLRSASVDSVICNAVLEHVRDADRVVSEMLRVVRPGGYVYAEVPFIFFFHGYPSDYRRFTREGLRQLFSQLPDASIGIAAGPMSALLLSGNAVLQMMIPSRLPLLRKAVNGAYRLLTFPLKYLDLLLNRSPEADIFAVGFYVLGRKPGA
jgi:uncharacterized protein YbaR (Trm112 family)